MTECPKEREREKEREGDSPKELHKVTRVQNSSELFSLRDEGLMTCLMMVRETWGERDGLVISWCYFFPQFHLFNKS